MNKKHKILSLQNVSFIADSKNILQSISLDIFSNSIISVIGPNGSGKTTLMKILLGIENSYQGKKIAHKKNLIFGYVPQQFLFSEYIPLKVKDFILLVENQRLSLDELNNLIKIDHLFDKKMQSLSGGELKKVLLARALIGKPDILVLDEPTSYLDFEAEKHFYSLILQIKQLFGCAIILVSHDLHLVLKQSDYVICLNKSVQCQGYTQDLLNDEGNYLSLYLHDHHKK